MKLNPPASSSDLDAAREIALRLHMLRRRAVHRVLDAREPRPVAVRRPAAPPPRPEPPAPLAPPLPAPSTAIEVTPEPPPPPSWDASVVEPAAREEGVETLADLGALAGLPGAPPADEIPLPDVEIEGGAVSPEEMIGSPEPAAALGDLAEEEAPPLPPSPFEIDLDDAGMEADMVGATAQPSWDDIAESCLGLSQASAGMLIAPAGQVLAAHGDWPHPGPDAIAAKLAATMDRTLKDAPTRSISAPLAGRHLTAWRVPITEGLVTVAFLGDAPVRTETRPAIDTEIRRGDGA